MNGKQELINSFSSKYGFSKAASGDMIANVLQTMRDTLENLDIDELASFGVLGNFKKILRAEHNGRNPRTGENLVIPAKAIIKFKCKEI